jgi:hypothetical protein
LTSRWQADCPPLAAVTSSRCVRATLSPANLLNIRGDVFETFPHLTKRN